MAVIGAELYRPKAAGYRPPTFAKAPAGKQGCVSVEVSARRLQIRHGLLLRWARMVRSGDLEPTRSLSRKRALEVSLGAMSSQMAGKINEGHVKRTGSVLFARR